MHEALVHPGESSNEVICSIKDDKLEEDRHITSALMSNGYPHSFIQGISRKSKRSRSDEQPVATVVLPYVKNVSESIRRILTPLNVRACFKLHKTLRNILVHAKGREHMNKKTGVIYQIPCGTCNEIYI